MKKKELKALAVKIAKAEQIISNSSNLSEIQRAENEIIDLSGRVKSLEDMSIIDEMVQEILLKNR